MTDQADIAAWRRGAAHADCAACFKSARAQIADVVRTKRPICLASGACCKFDEYGHRMDLSGLEAAIVVARIDAARAARAANPLRILEVDDAKSRGDCPYLRAGMCGEHEERPLGCRIFFCDKGADGLGADWQSELYEATHRDIIALHEQLGVPYRYLEWREALAMFART